MAAKDARRARAVCQLARATKAGNTIAIAEARAELERRRADAHIAELVAAAPVLDAEQLEIIAGLLGQRGRTVDLPVAA